MERVAALFSLLVVGTIALQCNVPGECEGQFNSFATDVSRSECLDLCKSKYFVKFI